MKGAKDYVKPTGPRIGRSGRTEKLYALENALSEAFRASSEELGRLMEHKKAEYFTHTLPEAIFSFLEGYDSNAVRLGVELWLQRHQHIED